MALWLPISASDTERFAGDPFRIIRREKYGGGRDVLWLTDSAERRLRFELLAKVLGRHVFQRRELIDPGVVDEDVERAERLPGLREQAPNLRFLRDIGLYGERLAAVLSNLGHDTIGTFSTGGKVDDHSRSL